MSTILWLSYQPSGSLLAWPTQTWKTPPLQPRYRGTHLQAAPMKDNPHLPIQVGKRWKWESRVPLPPDVISGAGSGHSWLTIDGRCPHAPASKTCTAIQIQSSSQPIGQQLHGTVSKPIFSTLGALQFTQVSLSLIEAFDLVPWGVLWGVLREYGVPNSLQWAIRSLYACSKSCVRILGIKSDKFSVGVGLRQGCPLSPVLFVIFMDRISRRSLGLEQVRVGLGIASVLFADGVVLLASSDRDLQHSLGRFAA